MLVIKRLFLSAVLAIAWVGAARAQALSDADLGAARIALAAAEAGDWSRAYADAAPIKDPLPLEMLHWLDYASPGAPSRFVDIADFIAKNPGWPHQHAMRRHAEEALSGESDAVAAEWLRRYPPISAAGQVRAGEILLNAGDTAAGAAALRAAWINDNFNATDEQSFLASHSGVITPQDDVERLDRLLMGRPQRGGAAHAAAGAAGMARSGPGAAGARRPISGRRDAGRPRPGSAARRSWPAL